MAGMCAARVLADFYQRVTVYERDDLPDTAANRDAVPQGRHVHVLMARGAQEFGNLFPGLLSDMVTAGVPILQDEPGSIYFGAAGHVLGIPTELKQTFTTYTPSRPHLEWQIRRRTAALPNVEVVCRAVDAPRFDAAAQQVTGVLHGDEFTAADLVVDATGRGTRLPVWLSEWGFERPTEETIRSTSGSATRRSSCESRMVLSNRKSWWRGPREIGRSESECCSTRTARGL